MKYSIFIRANITNFKKGEIIKTTPFEMVLIIRDYYEEINRYSGMFNDVAIRRLW